MKCCRKILVAGLILSLLHSLIIQPEKSYGAGKLPCEILMPMDEDSLEFLEQTKKERTRLPDC